MVAVVTFLVVATLSLLFTRLITGGLIATGMPPEIAAFQARSAFTGAGFTTSEAESVVNHDARRRLISTAMFVGNLGVPTLVVTVLFSLLGPSSTQTTTRVLVLLIGVVLLVVLMSTAPVTRFFVELGRRRSEPMIRRALHDSGTALLQLGEDYRIVTLPLHEDLELRSLRGLQAALPEVTVLGIRPGGREDTFLTGPPLDHQFTTGDEVVVLARMQDLDDLVAEVRATPDPGDENP